MSKIPNTLQLHDLQGTFGEDIPHIVINYENAEMLKIIQEMNIEWAKIDGKSIFEIRKDKEILGYCSFLVFTNKTK